MTPLEEIEIALYAMQKFADFTEFCKKRKTCSGCPYHITDLCEVMEPQDFIILMGTFIKSIGYKKILDSLKKTGD